MIFSKITIQFNLAKQQTNLHIILDRINKMTYNFISLLYQSNIDLTKNNKKYGDIILELERNTSQLFEKDFDYSGIFVDSLNDLYSQVSNFTGEFFYELITLIDNVHENYTIILSKSKNNSYDSLNEIINITKNSYIEYIYNMIKLLSVFENKTLLFLNNIEEEIKNIEFFQIDLLYDIIDLIYDGTLIIKEFDKNLFKAIEKGILIFKYDVKDFIENIIGDLLYITDFLSINLNKNEILKKQLMKNKGI